MKKILAILWTDFKVEFAYPSSLIFYLALPLVFTLIIGLALGGGASSPTAAAAVSLPVVDLDQSAASQQLVSSLESMEELTVTFAPLDEAQQMLANNEIVGYLLIPANFEASFNADGAGAIDFYASPQSATTLMVENLLRESAQQLAAQRGTARAAVDLLNRQFPERDWNSPQLLTRLLVRSKSALSEPPIISELTMITQNQTAQIMNGFNQSSAGQLVTWTLITMLGSSTVFIIEQRRGTLPRLASTPTRAITFLGGKFFSRWFMGLIQMLILVGFGIFILRVDWGESAATVFLFLASFAFSGTALGLMLGTLAQTPNQAGNLTTIISMMTAALGGAWWPLEITPLTFQHIVKILPTTWAMIGFNNIIIKRQTLSGVWDEMLILIGFGLAFLLVAWFNLNRVNGKRSVRTKTLNGE